MSKWIYAAFGLLILVIGVNGLLTGKIFTIISTGYGSLRTVTYENDFIEFCISIGLILYMGVMLIKNSLFSKNR